MIDITIEKMSEKHIAELAEVEQQSFSRPWSHDGLKAELDNPSAVFFVAVADGKAVGYIGFHTVLDEAYIANIAVLPEYRRKGIATALLQCAVDFCRENGFAFITLEVRQSNINSVALYKKFAFEIVGERKNFYTAPTENAYIMTLYFGGPNQ